MRKLFIPPDNDKFRNYFEAIGKGSCGPTVIAVILEKPVAEILGSWSTPAKKKIIDETNYKGYAPTKEMRKELESRGYSVKQRRGNKSRTFPTPKTDLAIIRIQWTDNGKEWVSFMEAARHSHYVLLKKDFLTQRWWVFCNDRKWFETDSKTAKDIFKRGYVSSYLEIS